MTCQEEINDLRILLGETDPLNSRWQDDPHLIYYVNYGRREFAKESKSLKGEFGQLTSVGATVAGNNEEARYPLDPLLIHIEQVYYDGYRVEPAILDWDEQCGRVAYGRGQQIAQGIPNVYRRVGNSIDIFPSAQEAKVLRLIGSIMTTGFTVLTADELELTPDQVSGAIHFAAAKALMDDGRDGRGYKEEGLRIARQHFFISNPSGSKGIRQISERAF